MKDDGRGATPFRIPVFGRTAQGEDELTHNAQANAHRARVVFGEPKDKPLAICGGGPSLAERLDELREWDGPIWAINRTPDYLAANGISSALVTVDACDNPGEFCSPESVNSALFSAWCNPAIVDRYADATVVEMFPLYPNGVVGTTTTAGCMAMVAARMGYRSVTLFGCEGSFVVSDHVDRHEARPEQFIIRAGGMDYRTTPALLMQCDELSRLFRDVPQFLKERSGGLLRAMVADPDWLTVAVSDPLAEQLEAMSGRPGLYATLYEGVGNAGE
jgi:hypothetical protein